MGSISQRSIVVNEVVLRPLSPIEFGLTSPGIQRLDRIHTQKSNIRATDFEPKL